jgi:L-amino acid N-acyltransferase YncA
MAFTGERRTGSRYREAKRPSRRKRVKHTPAHQDRSSALSGSKISFPKKMKIGRTTLTWVPKKSRVMLRQAFEIYNQLPDEWHVFNRLRPITSFDQLKKSPMHFFLATNDKGEPVGVCAMSFEAEKKRALIAHIFLPPGVKSRGHSKNLMHALFRIAKGAGMEKCYGYVSGERHAVAVAENRLMDDVGTVKVGTKPYTFKTGSFWLREKDLSDLDE